MDIMEFLNTNYQWLFSGLGVSVLIGLLKYFLGKKDSAPKVENKNSNQNIGSGNATQIVNQNNYHIENNNLIPQKEVFDSIENDAMLLEYIEHALKNLTEASKSLKFAGVKDTTNDYILIKKSLIDNKWSDYIENAASLNPKEKVSLKKWFRNVCELMRCVNGISWDNQILRKNIIAILNDKDFLAVKEKLADAVNQKRS